ncbi:hypothetical protein F7734_56220 [Scytonema sp. UIC 10036]|uniref:hypothetical protein n=1 Tax=Scytonema sp. UIC 10036 TaxID=2304196 RepID=UPI0012DA59F7|nr:hypothetical protein [Scytonema sp. UIC 10036]MUH01124.1 hypothetical protein [Scytonema sp. UIC 10036]
MNHLYCINCNDFTRHDESGMCLVCAYQYKEGDLDFFEPNEFPYNKNYEYQEETEATWLTEEDELIAQYGRHNLEFVRDQHWVDDSLEHYLGKYEA